MTCNCTPASNIACLSQGPDNRYSVAQQTCVITPANTAEPNPFFDSVENASYWAYNLLVECDNDAAVTDVYIPIYENIDNQSLTVHERILSCGRFEQVAYDFSPPGGVTPPAGFRFLHIPINDRFGRSQSAYYRLSIVGDFPPVQGTIYLETALDGQLTFAGNYLVPGEPAQPNLTVTKNSNVNILNNEAVINYDVTITNTGNVDLSAISYMDVINFDGTNIVIGGIEVTPPDINVDTSVSGTVVLSGDIGALPMGGTFDISYTLPIVSFAIPNTYVFNSTTQVSSGEVLTSINTTAQIEVVQFTTNSVCAVTSASTADFIMTLESVGNSPESDIIVEATIVVPPDVIVRFTSFGSCMAVFADTLQPVILNTDVTDRMILLGCPSTVPASGAMTYTINFSLISTTSISVTSLLMTNSFDSVILDNQNQQVTLGASPLPNVATLEINGVPQCSFPCEITE